MINSLSYSNSKGILKNLNSLFSPKGRLAFFSGLFQAKKQGPQSPVFPSLNPQSVG